MRASDWIDKDLRIDWDDVDLVILREVAARTGRFLEQVKVNPLYGHVATVSDLVRFFTHQPRPSGRLTVG